MKQMFETYEREPALSVLLREVSWTQNLLIMSRCRRKEERKFYLQMTRRENWSSRELERQIDGCLFERKSIAPVKLAAALRVLYPSSSQVFKDSYLLDFLDLPEPFDEHDLQKGLVANLKQFLLELGRDFCFVGEQYRVQVGNKDFLLDLLFYHRELRCLVAFELKVDDFKPEYLGKLSFYLEALDRDLRKSHENPSVGVLLCKSKDSEVVEYALSRTLSPALVAEYETKLPDRALLQAKLHELLQIAEAADEYGGRRKARR
jgi:predicted nuclease of restriction endonuclease-like (RecB) superfamily